MYDTKVVLVFLASILLLFLATKRKQGYVVLNAMRWVLKDD